MYLHVATQNVFALFHKSFAVLSNLLVYSTHLCLIKFEGIRLYSTKNIQTYLHLRQPPQFHISMQYRILLPIMESKDPSSLNLQLLQ